MFLCHLLSLHSAYIPVEGTAIAFFCPTLVRTSNEGKVLLLGIQFSRVHLHARLFKLTARSERLKWENSTESFLLPLVDSRRNTGMSSATSPRLRMHLQMSRRKEEKQSGQLAVQAGTSPGATRFGLAQVLEAAESKDDVSNPWCNRGQNTNNPDFLCTD